MGSYKTVVIYEVYFKCSWVIPGNHIFVFPFPYIYIYFYHSKTFFFSAHFWPIEKFHRLASLLTTVLFTTARSIFLTWYLGHVAPFSKIPSAWVPDGTQTLKCGFRGPYNVSPSLLYLRAHIWNLSFENNLLLIWIQAEHNFPDDSPTVCNISLINSSHSAHTRDHAIT